jgi:hypothetical protein
LVVGDELLGTQAYGGGQVSVLSAEDVGRIWPIYLLRGLAAAGW